MEHPKTDAPLTIDVRHADIDPWDEFLSEESDELQALQSGAAAADITPARNEPATFERVEVTPPSVTPPSLVTPVVEPPPADVVRVSIAPSSVASPSPATNPTPDDSPETVRAIEASPVLTDQERFDRLRSLAPFAVRRESREIATPAEPRTPVDRPTSAQVLSPTFGNLAAHASDPARAVPVPAVEPSPLTVEKPAPVQTRQVARPLAPPALIANGVSLRDVLARHTPVQWSEAVAVVEELCGELSAISQSTIPDLADVFITREGRVGIRPGAVGDPDIATLGRTLHALLASATPPLPLRLFVTSSISSDRFKSVALYADALSYYGTPRRAELIRDLYERAAQSVAPAPPAVEARTQSKPQDKLVVPVERSRRSQALLWTAAILVGGVIGTGVALVMWPSAPEVSASLKSASSPAPVAPHDDWQLGSLTVSETFKKKHPEARATRVGSKPADASSTPTRAGAATGAPKVPVTSSASSPSSLPTSAVSSAFAGAPPSATAPARSSITPPIETGVPAAVQPSTPPVALPAPAPDPTVYSEQDRDVTPPVMITKLPPPSAFSSPTDSQVSSTLELVVNTKGQVVTAKYVDRPTRLPDVAKLQEAKGWQFTPAMKDGHPVSYRYFLRTTTSPR